MDYAETLARLYAARRFGVKLDLDRIRRALARLGHPDEAFRLTVHIGGTNGKGSTAAFVDAILRAAGLRTALYTSPHLSRLSERFRIDGEPLPDGEVAAAYQAVAAVLNGDELTFFEQVTLMGLVAFAGAGVDALVLEVGLGGRGDATNVVEADVAAVTGVALDHQAWLGETLAEIAAEKAGIWKPGKLAVVGAAGEASAVPLLVDRARRVGVDSLVVVGEDVPAVPPVGWELGLAGPHQRANAACALAIAGQIEQVGFRLDAEARRRGLAEARLAGRLETVAEGPRVVLDGAHNPHAAEALARALPPLGGARRALVVGVSRDKDAAGMLAPLCAGADLVVTTQSSSDRALPAGELAELARAAGARDVTAVAEPARAIDHARAWAEPEDLVLVTGSLFLVGDARRHLCGDARDPLVVGDPLGPPGKLPAGA